MKLNLLILCALVGLTFLFTFVSEKTAPLAGTDAAEKQEKVEFSKVPVFTFFDLNGNKHESTDYKGKVMLVNFWASWCIPCIAEFPKLLQIAARYPDDVSLIAISTDAEMDEIDSFLDRFSKSMYTRDNVVLVHDKEKIISYDLFQSVKMPETIIVDVNGNMIDKIVGADWEIEDITPIIDAALENSTEVIYE